VGRHSVKSRHQAELKAFGENLRRIRIAKGFTQEQLADLANISENSVITLESGKLNSTIATCFALAKVLEIEPQELFKF